jgi:hypothetical protein
MKNWFKAIAQASFSILLLSACAPTEGYTNQFPQHVTDVIEQFEQGGYACEDPSVYLSNGNAFMDSEYAPDGLSCNKSDSNILGDGFNVFASKAEALSYYQQSCNDRQGGWFIGAFMISPTVEMDSYEKTLEEANKLAKFLGYSGAQEIGSSCDYNNLTW